MRIFNSFAKPYILVLVIMLLFSGCNSGSRRVVKEGVGKALQESDRLFKEVKDASPATSVPKARANVFEDIVSGQPTHINVELDPGIDVELDPDSNQGDELIARLREEFNVAAEKLSEKVGEYTADQSIDLFCESLRNHGDSCQYHHGMLTFTAKLSDGSTKRFVVNRNVTGFVTKFTGKAVGSVTKEALR